jgi:hypothetical protein
MNSSTSISNSNPGFFGKFGSAVSGAVGGVTNFFTGKKNNANSTNVGTRIPTTVGGARASLKRGRRKMRKTKTKARKTKRRASHKRRTARKH